MRLASTVPTRDLPEASCIAHEWKITVESCYCTLYCPLSTSTAWILRPLYLELILCVSQIKVKTSSIFVCEISIYISHWNKLYYKKYTGAALKSAHKALYLLAIMPSEMEVAPLNRTTYAIEQKILRKDWKDKRGMVECRTSVAKRRPHVSLCAFRAQAVTLRWLRKVEQNIPKICSRYAQYCLKVNQNCLKVAPK